MNYNKKTKKELIEEIEELKSTIGSSKINEKGLSVINNYEADIKNTRRKATALIAKNFIGENEEKYRFLFYQNPVPMWLYDKKTLKFLDVNDAAVKYYGYTKEEFLQMTLWDIRHKEEIPKLKKFIKAKNENEVALGEWIHKKKNGENIYVEITRGTVQQEGESVGVAIINDITEKKQKELELLKKEAKLKEQNKILLGLARITSNEQLTRQDIFSQILNQSANVLNIGRIGIWFFENNKQELVNNLLYESENKKYSSGARISSSYFPIYFKALTTERIIVAENACLNPLTAEFSEFYHKPHQIQSLLDVPLRHKGEVVGVICFENIGISKKWTLEDQTYASSIADLIHIALDAEERKKAEVALASSEERFRMLAENAIDIVYRYRMYPENGYEYVSPSVKDLTGYTPEDFYADPYLGFKIVHPEDQKILGNSEKLVKEQVQIKNFKEESTIVRWVKKNGDYIWTETRNKPILNSEGRVVAIEGISRDITKRVKLENDLVSSKESYKRLIDALPSGVLIHLNGKIQYANNAAFKIFGLSSFDPDDIYNLSLYNYIPAKYHYKVKELEERVLKGEQLQFIELKAIGAENKLIDLETKSILIDYNGSTAIQTIFNDISYRKKVEQTLRESEEKFRLLSASAPIGIYLADSDGSIAYYNEKLQEILGKDLSLSFLSDWLKIVHKEDIEIAQNSLNPEVSGINNEFRIVRNGREMRWVKFLSTKTKATPGKKRGWVGIFQDITQRKDSEELLRESEQRFRLLSDAAMEGIVLSEKGKIIDVNDRFIKMHGYKNREGLIMKNFLDFIVPEQQELAFKFINQEKENTQEFTTISKDGEKLFVEAKNSSIPYHGRLVQATVLTDITQRRNYELELEQSKENYKSLIETSPDGIMIYMDGKFVFANPTARKLFGFEEADTLDTEKVYGSIHKEYHQKLKERLDGNSSAGSPDFFEIALKSSTAGEVEAEAQPIPFTYMGAPAIMLVLHDFTNQKKLAREVLRAQLAEETNLILQQEINEHKKTQKKLIETERYTRNIIDSSLDMICATDAQGKITEYNKSAQQIFGYSPEEVIGKSAELLYRDRDQYLSTSHSMGTKGKFEGEVWNRKKNGETFLSYLAAANLYAEDGSFAGVMGVSRDITKIKDAENQLRLSEENYRAIYNQIFIGIGRIALDGKFLQVNKQLGQILGYEEEELLQMTFMDVTPPEDLEKSIKFREDLLAGKYKNFTIEKRYYHKNESIIHANLTSALVHDVNGAPSYFLSVFQDITERKKIEEQVSSQSARLKAIFEGPSHEFYTINKNHILTSFNEKYQEDIYACFGERPVVGINVDEASRLVFPPEQVDVFSNAHKKALEGKPQSYIFTVKNLRGEDIWYESHLNPIVLPGKEIEEVSYVTQDITEKKVSEERIKQSLKEKEVLLKEVHHRVKNNLQVISSILNLQSSYVKDQYTLEMLRESQNRIKSMSFIHESLYQTKDFAEINFSEYVINLSKNLIHSYRIYEEVIELKLDVEVVHLNLDMAIPSGLIINELVSNSLKYAFPNNRKGIISISLHQRNGIIEMNIGDNGIGLPSGLDFRNTESLGLQLVVTLVEQLNGQLNLKPDEGTNYKITFKAHQQRLNKIQ